MLLSKMQALATQIKALKENSPELAHLLEESIAIVTDPAIKSDPKQFQYFSKDFTLTNFTAILKLTHQTVSKSAIRLLEEYIALLPVEIKEDNSDFLYSLAQLFDPAKQLYTSATFDTYLIVYIYLANRHTQI
jgi:hypothetical protein